MKYTINVPDEYTVGGKFGVPVTINGHTAWIGTGIKLEPYEEPDLEAIKKEAYDKGKNDACNTPVEVLYRNGLSDAWDAARKIESLSACEFTKIFTGYDDCFKVFENYTPQEAIEKIWQYEQEKEKKIYVGDEVNCKGDKGIITRVSDDDGHFNVMWANGSTGYYTAEDFEKTGRNFSEIVEVLMKLNW